MGQYSASLIVSFYNRIDYLKTILAAVDRQSFKDFEIIIADDGSNPYVVGEINQIKLQSRIPITHVWHADIGFRKTTILNKAIRQSKSDYLIFIDGDCIPHHKFIEEHFLNRELKTVLAGRRSNISPRLAKNITEETVRAGYLESGFIRKMIFDGVFGESTHVIKGIYIGNSAIRRFLNRKVTGLLGSNFSIHKSDLIAVNGFDERYKAPAVGEDTDLEARLTWNDVKLKMVKNMAVQFHFDHPKLKRSEGNQEIFKKVLSEKQAYTPFGINNMEVNDTKI